MPIVQKHYLKTITIQDKYSYRLLDVEAGTNHWVEAEPISRGCITRTAENEGILRIILENDAIRLTKEQQRVR